MPRHRHSSAADSAVLGDFHAGLLEQIRETGSITRAAVAVGISYRTAWSHVDRLNQLSGRPVVERTAGGKSGGGTRLTSYGTGLLKAYRILQEKHARYVKDLRKGIHDFEDFQRLARGMSLQTSARNQLFGTVESVKIKGLEAEVVLKIKGGDRLKSRITRRGAEELGIRKGSDAYALIKANWIVLATPGGRASASHNVMRGRFEEIRRERGRIEASVLLDGGEVLRAAFPEKAAAGIRLEKGASARVKFDAENVILGITDVPRF